MKLMVIWLLGVPLAVAAMCTAAALWQRPATGEHGASKRAATPSAAVWSGRQSDV